MKELPKAYQPADYEDRIYAAWEKSGAFKPASDTTAAAKKHKPYTIIMPPPNATARLHTGHAIMVALEDALVRYHRMKGFDTLYLPGVDHAAIATASMIDKELAEKGKHRADLGRAKFDARAKEFAQENKQLIETQIRALGASADWSRNAFTMDKPREAAVKEAFRRLYKKGLIYRGDYMVNWCPECRTVLADDEVEHVEQEAVLYYMKYGPFTLATTRPETKVGDTAVAVHPDDKRYKKYVGQTIDVQTINGVRQLLVIADDMVDPEFGTGVVKITPFHDRNDYEVYLRHPEEAGPPLEVIGEDGVMTEAAGKLAGLDRFAARKKMVDWLKKRKLLVREEVFRHSIGRCYRSDDVIEPRISKQWFVKVSEIKEQAIKFVDDEQLKFVPSRFEKIYRDWLTNLHDWCISRQVWFGHPVPAYLNKEGKVSLDPQPEYKASEDTLDTWFSSALWPFSTLGWPTKSADFKRFFPGDVLETGYDIIFFWITRMVLMTIALEAKDEKTKELLPPFHTAYLHGLVRDKRGRKFSKTLGNGVDPLELIGKYGADALRFMLATSGTPGNDIRFDEERVASGRNFANKLWNISRFILAQEPGNADLQKLQAETLTTFDRAILHHLHHTARSVEGAFYDEDVYAKPGDKPVAQAPERGRKYDLGAAGNELYAFVWSEFADWYVEAAKVQLKNEDTHENTKIILRFVLETILKLLHPYMPFITEVIWSEGFGHKAPLITTAWPEPHEDLDQPEDAERYGQIKEVVEAVRRLRADNKVPAGAWVQTILVTDEPEWLLENADVINQLARLKMLRVRLDEPDAPDLVKTVAGQVTVYLPTAGLVDPAAEEKRLQREIAQAKMEVERLQKRLENKDYASKAPAKVVAQTKADLTAAKERLRAIQAELDG